MAILQVDALSFDFAPTITADNYDAWQHHCNVLNKLAGGRKAVDVLAVDAVAPGTTWLIEAKDFRIITQPPNPCNLSRLAQTMADKVRDTRAGLVDASANAVVPQEKLLATNAIACPHQRMVLHVEPHVGAHTALFPGNFVAGVLQQLRILMRTVDPNPLVLDIANTPRAGVPWTVT